MDIQCANKYSFALCNISILVPLLLRIWLNYQDLPEDIVQLIQSFCDMGHLYKTRYTPGLIEYDTNNKYWRKITELEHVNIVKIACGSCYSLCLDDEGVIWCYGLNTEGQLGIISQESVQSMTKLYYLHMRNIKIRDIACGESHNVALDNMGNVYVWGNNQLFQLGDFGDNIVKPKCLGRLRQEYIIQIGCGLRYSFALTKTGKYYLWGSNSYHQCLQFTARNRIFPQLCQGLTQTDIRQVYLGNDNTILITNCRV